MRAARARFCAVPTSLLTLRFFFMGSSVGSLSGAACTSHTSKRSAAPIGIAAAVGMGSHTCKGATTPSSEPPTCTVGPAAMLLQGASAIASIVLFVVLRTANALLLSAVAIVVGLPDRCAEFAPTSNSPTKVHCNRLPNARCVRHE